MGSENEIALITGASAGIGRAFAKVFAEHDYDVVLAARSKDKLEALAEELRDTYDVDARAVQCDLSDPKAPGKLFAAMAKEGLEIDVLVNNAGQAIMEPFVDTPAKDHQGLVQLNVAALTVLSRLFLPQMIARGSGRILNVASIVSFFPTPSFAVYGATKAYVLSLSEALSQELHGTGVTVTALCPGYTDTAMTGDAIENFGQKGLERYIPSIAKMSPEECAREGFKACMNGKTVAMDRWSNELAAQWVKWQPRWLIRNAGGIMSRLVRK